MIRLKNKKLQQNNNEDDGFTYPLILGIIFILFLGVMFIVEYMYFMTTYSQIDDAVERSVIAVATENWQNVYQSVREGFAGGNTKDQITDAWTVKLNKKDIMKETQDMLELDSEGGKFVKKDEKGNIRYTINPTTIEANIINVPISEGGVDSIGSGKGLIVDVSYDISVAWPSKSDWLSNVPIQTRRNVQVQYKPKF